MGEDRAIDGPGGIGPRRRRWTMRVAAGVAAAVLASTVGILAGTPATSAAPRPATPPPAAPPAAGPGIGASATGKVDPHAALPGDAGSSSAPALVPGTVRVTPDRSPFRTPEPLATPLDKTKIGAAMAGATQLEVGPLAVGDVNGDGIDDIVNGVQVQGPSVKAFASVMLGLGDGQYTDPTFSLAAAPQWSAPYDLALADVDGDHHLDVIMTVTDLAKGALVLLLGVGDGTFGAPITSNVVANPGYLRVGSWGGSAAVQIVVTGAEKKVHVLDVTGDGFDDLTPAGVEVLNPTQNYLAVTSADVDGDHQDELYVSMESSPSDPNQGVQRLTDLTTASPSKTWVAGVPNGPRRIAIADVDGDHHLDLVAVEYRSVSYQNQYWLRAYPLPGRSPDAAPFGEVRVSNADDQCRYTPAQGKILPADVDADGDMDLVMIGCAQELNYVRVARNDGTGTFTLSHYIATPGERGTGEVAGLNRRPTGVAIIDANGDDRPDLVWAATGDGIANGDTVVLGDADHDGELQAPRFVEPGQALSRDPSFNAQQALIVDWDEDGTKDVVLLADSAIVWRKGDGSGRFGAPQVIDDRTTSTWCPATGAGELGAKDLDGDGHVDLACHTPGKTGMAWGAGPGQPLEAAPLNEVQNTSNWNGYHGIDMVDLDGNGLLDLVIPVFTGDFDEGSYGYVWFQGADRSWPASPAVAKMGSATTLAVGNVDGDPEPELVALIDRRKDAGGTVQWFDRVVAWSADGHGGLTEHVSDTVASRVADGIASVPDVSQGLGDLDGDGIADLVTIWYYGNPLYQHKLLVWKGLGNGEFSQTADAYPTTQSWQGNGYQRGGDRIAIRDIDGDGNRDVAYDSTAFGVEIYPGNGDGTLGTSRVTRWPAGAMTGSLAIGDLDADGKPDMIAGTNWSYTDGPQLTHALLMNRSIPGSDAAPDLAITDVSAPTAIGDGDEVSVQVTVTNQGGDVRSSATWTDAAWLSTTPGVTLSSASIATKTRQGPLAAGASYTVTLTGPAEAVAQGAAHLVVRTDATRRVTEADESNDEAVRDVTVSTPTLVPGGAPLALHVAEGHRRIVRIPAVAGRTVSITATPASAGGARGRLAPDAAPRPGTGVPLRATGTGPLVGSLGRTTDGDLYLVVEGLSAGGTDPDGPAAAVTLVATDATTAVTAASPGRVANQGDATLTVTGVGLDGAAFSLEPHGGASGPTVAASAVRAGPAGTWFATFPLADQLGAFDLRAGDVVLPSAVVVEDPVVTPNAREVEVSVSLPGQMRRHVRGPGGEVRPGYPGRVVVRNRTGHDLPAPYIRIEADGLDVAWPDVAAGQRSVAADADPGDERVLSLLGTTPGGPVDVLPARASVTIELRAYATMQVGYSLQVGVWTGSDQTGELDHGDEASALASAYGLPASTVSAIEQSIDLATSHPVRPTYPNASPTGPWPTPGGFTLALDRMAASLDAAGQDVGSLGELRHLVVLAALADADVGAPISGRVDDGGSGPGVPLEITALPVDGKGTPLVGEVAPDGRFNLFAPVGRPAPTAERYRFEVEHRIADDTTVELTPGTPIAGVALAVERGVRAEGHVTSAATGRPIAGAQVLLAPSGIADAAPLAGRTRADGGYRIDGLVPGAAYQLAVRADGYASVVAQPVTAPASGAVTEDRTLADGSTISGHVTGTGAVGAQVSARSGGELVAADTVADDGTYALEGIGAGSTDVDVVADGGATAHRTVTVSGDADLDLALAAGRTVSGTVVDRVTGDPIAGAVVHARAAGAPVALAPATTGSDGTFAIEGVPVGQATLVASASGGRKGAPTTIDVATQGTGVELTVGGLHTVHGVVRDQAGDPLPGVEVSVLPVVDSGSGEPLPIAGGTATTDADGAYTIRVEGPGHYRASTVGDDQDVVLADDQVDPAVDLTSTATSIHGVVHLRNGSAAAGVLVTLVRGGTTLAEAETKGDGTYQAVVGAGPLDVWVGAPGVGVDHEQLTVPASGDAAVPTLGEEAGSLAVTVTGVANPVEGTATLVPQVGAESPAVGPEVSIVLADDGTVRFDGLAPGGYDLVLRGNGFTAARHHLTVAGDAVVSVAALATPPRTSAITDAATGDPVVGAIVTATPSAGDPGGASDLAVTGDDGSFTFAHLPAGTYDLWVSSTTGANRQVATGVVIAAPAPVAPTGVRATSDAGGGLPSAFPFDAQPGASAIKGQVVGANGTGMGAVPPTITASRGDQSVPVTVRPDGSFTIDGASDGDITVTLSKDGFETKSYKLTIPKDNGKKLDFPLGLPLAAASKLEPIEDPRFLSWDQVWNALFIEKPLTYRDEDPMMQTIYYTFEEGRCPGGVALLKRAKRAAWFAMAQNETYNQVVRSEYWERINNWALLVTEVTDLAATVVAALIPLGRGIEAAFFGGRAVLIRIAEGDISKAGAFVKFMDYVSNLPFASLAADFAGVFNAVITGGSLELDGVLFSEKSALDILYLLAKDAAKNLESVVTKDLVQRSVGSIIALGGILTGINDIWDKSGATITDIKDGYALLKADDLARDTAADQVTKLEQRARALYEAWKAQQSGADCDQPKDLPRYDGGVGSAVDPNEMVGPSGQGSDRWLARPLGLGYEVHFENLGPGTVNPPPGVPLATAPAADVVVTETIPSSFDRSTFSFADLGWGSHAIDLPPGLQSFEVDEPITVTVPAPTDADPKATAQVDLVVRVSGDFDPGTGEATWRFRTLDPDTGKTPLDPAAGFLPPEPGDERGQGWIRYTVDAAADDVQGTNLDAKASIVFDTNDPIDTNLWRNRVGTPGGDVCPSTDTPNGRFVCALYRSALGREPDAAGRAYWLGRLARPASAGGTTRAKMATAFVGSLEGRRAVVDRLFQEELGRKADPSGKAFWAARLGRKGARRDDLRRALLGSDEYLRHAGGTRAGFVADLYQDALGRPADPAGAAHWVAALQAGRSRGSVAAAFLATDEARRRTVRTSYQRLLDRAATSDEVRWWALDLARTRNDEVRLDTTVLALPEFAS